MKSKEPQLIIERYDFSVCSQPFELGKKSEGCLRGMKAQIQGVKKLIPERLLCNSPAPGLFHIHGIYFGYQKMNAVGIDAFILGPQQFEVDFNWRALTQFEDLTVLVEYNGKVPKGYKKGLKFFFVLSIQGQIEMPLYERS